MTSNEKPAVPDTLTVILADTQSTYIAVVHENEHRPYERRTVQVKLTEEQRRAIAPLRTGMNGGKPTHEAYLQAWLEPATRPLHEEGNDEDRRTS